MARRGNAPRSNGEVPKAQRCKGGVMFCPAPQSKVNQNNPEEIE